MFVQILTAIINVCTLNIQQQEKPMKIIIDNPIDTLDQVRNLISYQHWMLLAMTGGPTFGMEGEDISGQLFLLEIQKQIMDGVIDQLEAAPKPKAVAA
jgi:hypothetical protein